MSDLTNLKVIASQPLYTVQVLCNALNYAS